MEGSVDISDTTHPSVLHNRPTHNTIGTGSLQTKHCGTLPTLYAKQAPCRVQGPTGMLNKYGILDLLIIVYRLLILLIVICWLAVMCILLSYIMHFM